jgi:hypothetical protein
MPGSVLQREVCREAWLAPGPVNCAVSGHIARNAMTQLGEPSFLVHDRSMTDRRPNGNWTDWRPIGDWEEKKMRMLRTSMAVLIAIAPVAACGGEDPVATPSQAPITGPLLPWKVGNTWTYQVTAAGEVSTKTTTVGGLEKVGGVGPNQGKDANQATTMKKDGSDKTESWQVLQGTRVVRYREISYAASTGQPKLEEHWDPCKLHVDWTPEKMEKGYVWLEQYTETKLPQDGTLAAPPQDTVDAWTVEELAATVSVPAGTFTNAVVLTKASGDTLKTYWYVPSVGKVKEIGGQTEELVAFKVGS